MTSAHSLPTLFGRLTALQTEHEQLHAHLDAVRELCALLSVTSDGPFPEEAERIRLIADWREQLCRHFAAEESQRYFGMLVSERPALIPRIAELRGEHAAMLDALELLLRLASDAQATAPFAERALRLVEQLEHHELAESALMQEFFAQAPED